MNTTFSSSPLQQTLMLPAEQGVSIQRFDKPKYRQFLKLYEAQLQSFWMPDEIDMKTDRTNMSELTEAEEHVVMSNIKRQILLDSIMGRAPISVFGPAISDPTLEACVQAWTNMECLHSDTEVLTPHGWISISEITTQDLVCQFDPKNGSFSFVNPSAVTFKKTDKAISFFNGIFEQFVTPNHRMCVVNGDYSGGFIEARSFINGDVDVLGFINAGRLENSNVSAPSDTDLYTIMLSELNGKYNEEEDIYEVLIERDSKHNAKFLDIMNKMGLYFDTFEESPSSNFIKYQITEASRCIGANNLKSELSSILLTTPYNYLDSHYCKFILDEMLFWSGSVHNLNGTDYYSYSSDNKNKIDFVQTIASLAGAKTRVSKSYCSSTNNTKLVVYIYDGLPYEELGSLNIAEIELNEPTVFYCLTVPTSAFLIRYNNKISVTGNCLHSYSYTHIIQQSFVNPTKTLDEVMSIEQIVKCKDSVVKYYDKCIDSVDKYYRGEIPRIDAVRDVWLALNTANALESVRFQLSFACSFIFGQTGKLPGLARIVKLIQRDELLHVAITNNLIKVLPQDDIDFAMIKEEEEVKRAVEEIWRDAVLEEDEWAKYLFSKGEIFAFNYRILNQYLRYIVTSRLEKNELPKLEELCDMKSEYVNPIPWILKWTGEEKDQTAPQESELTNYERATFDISNGSFDNIEM